MFSRSKEEVQPDIVIPTKTELNKMKKAELLDFGGRLDLELSESLTKVKIIEAILNHDADDNDTQLDKNETSKEETPAEEGSTCEKPIEEHSRRSSTNREEATCRRSSTCRRRHCRSSIEEDNQQKKQHPEELKKQARRREPAEELPRRTSRKTAPAEEVPAEEKESTLIR
ncbi:MAG: hypothetical protein CM15mP127_11640 [Gammaproteobacteria bacterium]|nr:MAG: hypothetical protein CM15mP127_11640 [Gammaproteobacteria bacterium]